MSYKELEIAKEIAREVHKGQKRSDGKDYITHPEAVAKLVGVNVKLQTIAWLHDVLEDSNLISSDLVVKGISNDLVIELEILTREKTQNYEDYILRISASRMATIVKLADLRHNLSNLKKGRMRDKYILAEYILNEALTKLNSQKR